MEPVAEADQRRLADGFAERRMDVDRMRQVVEHGAHRQGMGEFAGELRDVTADGLDAEDAPVAPVGDDSDKAAACPGFKRQGATAGSEREGGGGDLGDGSFGLVRQHPGDDDLGLGEDDRGDERGVETAVLQIAPFAAFKAPTAAWAQRNGPIRLVLRMLCQKSSLSRSSSANGIGVGVAGVPALLTRKSRRPSASIARLAIVSASPGFATLPGAAMIRCPSPFSRSTCCAPRGSSAR